MFYGKYLKKKLLVKSVLPQRAAPALWRGFRSDVPPFSKGLASLAADHDVVNDSNLYQPQRFCQPLGDAPVGIAGSGSPEGWLWTKITAAALQPRACLICKRSTNPIYRA